MWPAQIRAALAVPPRSLEELRPQRGTVALRVTAPGCPACARFEVEDRADFEAQLGLPVVEWNCTCASHRRAALAAGVHDVPAYVILPSRGAMQVRLPLAGGGG